MQEVLSSEIRSQVTVFCCCSTAGTVISAPAMKCLPGLSVEFGFAVVAAWIAVSNPAFAACPCNSTAPDGKEVEPTKPKFNSEDNLTGDWFGLRNTLYDYGIDITAGYTTEPAGSPLGGLKQGGTYLH